MSTAAKRAHSKALYDACEIREMLSGTFLEWEFAGSLRRKKPEVSDVDHVIIPKSEMGVNLLWKRLDELTAVPNPGLFDDSSTDLPFSRYFYSNGQNRWGQKQRGVQYRGYLHEFVTADVNNFGNWLSIKTGPAEFSEMLVTKLKQGGKLRQQEGYLRRSDGSVVPCRTEAEYFQACGVKWIAPEKRV